MDVSHIIALALLQGLTEFLPISSSAHLILLPRLVAWTDQGLAFDVAVHFGTLTAVIAYFRHEVVRMLADWLRSLVGRGQTAESRLAWAVAFGTVPAGLAGLVFSHGVETYLRSPMVIASTTIGFGLLLGWADVRAVHRRDEYSIGWWDVLVIGLAQALALMPGTSRSGITMTAGLMLGLSRAAAARFSFLLSIPVIVLSASFETRQLIQAAAPVDWNSLLLGVALSAASAYLCIHFFLKLLDRIGFMPFVVYRLLLGAVLILLSA